MIEVESKKKKDSWTDTIAESERCAYIIKEESAIYQECKLKFAGFFVKKNT